GWVDRRVRDRRNHMPIDCLFVFFSSRRRHTRSKRDWSSDVCSSDLSGSDQFHAFDGDMAHGIDQIQTYKAGMEEILRQYPGCKRSEERRVGEEGIARSEGDKEESKQSKEVRSRQDEGGLQR